MVTNISNYEKRNRIEQGKEIHMAWIHIRDTDVLRRHRKRKREGEREKLAA